MLDPQLDLECLRIPHFYNAFYVYKYATGISAAVALSERVLAGEAGSVESYLAFLKSGGSKYPLETLQLAGVDMTTPAPIESTLRLFEERLGDQRSVLRRSAASMISNVPFYQTNTPAESSALWQLVNRPQNPLAKEWATNGLHALAFTTVEPSVLGTKKPINSSAW